MLKFIGVALIVGSAVVHELGWSKRIFDLCRSAQQTKEPEPIRLSSAEVKELETVEPTDKAAQQAQASLAPYLYLFCFALLLFLAARDVRDVAFLAMQPVGRATHRACTSQPRP